MSINPRVSAIIPVFKDWENLKKCLHALEQQSYPRERFEILVINNQPAAEAPPFLPLGNHIKLHEPRPGSYAARNAGIRAARAA